MSNARQSHLLIPPKSEWGEYQSITPQQAGWDLLHFAARKMQQGERWQHTTGQTEMAVVILGGTCTVEYSGGVFKHIGERENVFSGMPTAVYFPRNVAFTIQAESESLDIAYGWCATDQDHPVQLIRPQDVRVEIRGGGNATRQINDIIPPGFDCHRLVVVEVYTPAGNWSSYPPHKHDVHRESEDGTLLEADLEEIYFYKVDRPHGYAVQRVYTPDRRLDELILAQHNDLVLVPEGYHPVVAAHGYTIYYLNMLAGSAQSLANSDDPEHAWIKETWVDKDPRVPVVK